MLPTFLVIGAQKAGTTSLRSYLRQHARIFMVPYEVRYFVAERTWSRGQEWYEGLFAEAGEMQERGEKSVNYTMNPRFRGVPERIASVIPTVKLVYLVRDPVRRALSHYRNFVIDGRERRAPAEALLRDSVYIDPSRYLFQLEQYLRYFPREQILVVRNEDLETDPAGLLARVAQFVGVEPAWPPQAFERRWNETASKELPRGLVRGLRRLPGWRSFDEALPKTLKKRARRVTHVQSSRIEIPAAVVRELEARLRGDFVELCDHWLESPTPVAVRESCRT